MPDRLDRLLGQWLLGQGAEHPLICVDGKTFKGTDGLHLFSAFCGTQEIVVAQIAVPEKTNEIPMLSVLLQEVPLAGTLVTADALHTQTDTARHLVQERGADYLSVVKDNQFGRSWASGVFTLAIARLSGKTWPSHAAGRDPTALEARHASFGVERIA